MNAAYREYSKLMQERQEIIRLNASLRLRRLPTQPVPPKPPRPMIPVAYEADGTYAGVCLTDDDVDTARESGLIIKMEPA